MIQQLRNLVQFHVDAVYAYETAMARASDPSVVQLLESFRDDHVEHALELSSLIFGYGGRPPKAQRDRAGFLLENATLPRSKIQSTEDALQAIRLVEIVTNRVYQDILTLELPAELREVIMAKQWNEGQHLDKIELKIEEIRARQPNSSTRAQSLGI